MRRSSMRRGQRSGIGTIPDATALGIGLKPALRGAGAIGVIEPSY